MAVQSQHKVAGDRWQFQILTLDGEPGTLVVQRRRATPSNELEFNITAEIGLFPESSANQQQAARLVAETHGMLQRLSRKRRFTSVDDS